MACSDGPRPFLNFDGDRITLVSNSRTAKNGPRYASLRKHITDSSRVITKSSIWVMRSIDCSVGVVMTVPVGSDG